MQDRALLDEETAWLLFGGTDIQGLSFKINGVPFVVAGVIEREQDFATKKAYTDGMGIFISYDGYMNLFGGTADAASAADTGSDASAGQGGAGFLQIGAMGQNPGDEFKLGDIWHGVSNTAIQNEFASCNVYAREECRDCWARLYCSGGCAANAYHATGSVRGVYKEGCELFKKRMECAIMVAAARELGSEE